MKTLDVSLCFAEEEPIPVGRLAHHGRDVLFEYDDDFLARGLDISPFCLPLEKRTWRGAPELFDGLPGVIDDSLPDGWGRLLIDRHFRRHGIATAQLSPLDRLAYLGSRTMGALTYHPPTSEATQPQDIDLDLLARESEEVLRGDTAEVLEQLLRVGGSSGGARPKALVGIRDATIITGDGPLPEDYEPWIVKFRGTGDERDAGAVEYVYSQMASRAGLRMAPCRLLITTRGARLFATRRFDRIGGRRRHAHSLANLLHRSFRVPSFDYEHLLKVCLRLTRDRRYALEAYRHMLFNVFAWNRDDHAKNFGFIMDDEGRWSLSPSYDVMFSAGYQEMHFTTVAGEGRAPDRSHLKRLAELIDLPAPQLRTMEEEVRAALGAWPALAEEQGIERSTIDRLAEHHARAATTIDRGPAFR